MPLEELIQKRSDDILRISERHGVDRVRVFGSVARGQSRPDSDLDLLVRVGPNPSPWFPAGLIVDLQNLLDCRVDVVTESGLLPELRAAVLQDARPL